MPTLNQLVLEQFIASGEYERHLNRMKNNYKSKRDFLIDKFNNCSFKDKIIIHGEEAGLHFLVDIKTNVSEKELVEMAKAKGIRVYSLSEFYLDKSILSNKKTMVFGYSNLSYQEIGKGIGLLEQAWKNI